MIFKYWLLIVAGFVISTSFCSGLSAQVLNENTPAVPFLLITPDARIGAMGEAGVAILPDVNSTSINPSKLAFLNQGYGISLSYSPWLRNLASDMNLGYLSGYYKLNKRNAIAGSIRYFSLGKIQLVDANQQDLGVSHPNEFAIDGSFARKFGPSFSLATSLRYIRSAIGLSQWNGSQEYKAGTALAVDISAYYKKETYFLGSDAIVAGGAYLSNIGTKMAYANGGSRYFLPANLKVGGASTFLFNNLDQLTVALDFNKLLVNEELQEVNIASGAEYIYNQQFALRGGFYSRYFTLGAGFKYDVMNIDLAYLIGNTQTNPLANTLRFTLLFNFSRTNN